MIFDEFLDGLQFIKGKYGQIMPIEHAQSLFNHEWQDRDYKPYMRACMNRCSQEKAPNLREVEVEYLRLANERVSKQVGKCKECFSGWVGFVVRSPDTGKFPGKEHEIATRCRCALGKAKSSEIAFWDEINDPIVLGPLPMGDIAFCNWRNREGKKDDKSA